MSRHFLRLGDFTESELHDLISRAIELKRLQQEGSPHPTCAHKTLAMIFELSSTRTRVSFEAGMAQLGGQSVFLSPRDTQLGRGEPIKDTARVLAKMVDIVMIRAKDQSTIDEYAQYSDIPVMNGMSNELHPCQLLADIMTIVEAHGEIEGQRIAFVGDGYNMCQSFIEASTIFGFELKVATPPDYRPSAKYLTCSNQVEFVDSPLAAVNGANVVVTDVWSSMDTKMTLIESRRSTASKLIRSCSIKRKRMLFSCTVCPRIEARKWTNSCSTIHALRCGRNRATAFTRKKR